ncbi:baseplate J/gp47 family protein [Mesorhizobium sp. WSM4906]|uniref:baseplate J/gp47 family protein n=1 Tax=Mesorhizobium sp. WSM4906 TaxID=3038546 RepID=UPI002416BF3B|nr:baseplate J/gp47 family protein [Mesorhizobium sp. WSM4906]WFP74497.1 baseplate J/gp47 family protein [Mesorhizobium sp. WSM4906]
MLDLSTLEGLPDPQAITVTSEAAALAAIKAVFVDLATSYGLDVSGIIDLEGEPGNIQLQVGAFREVLYRAAINDGVKANLLAFAAGADLDHLAAFYDVIRLAGETDARLRARTVVAISGRSTAGSEDWYRTAAFRASVRVKDVAAYRVGTGPDIRIAVLATDNFGEPDAALLAAVNDEVQKNSVRVISDRITVLSATSATVNVVADVWLLPTTPITVFDSLETLLRQALSEEGGLGFNVTRSWLIAKLQAPGVQRVSLSSPVADVAVDDGAAVKIGTVTLTYKGRDR